MAADAQSQVELALYGGAVAGMTLWGDSPYILGVLQNRDQIGVARIQRTGFINTYGQSRILVVQPRDILGVARITASTTRDQIGRASILNAVTRTQIGTARILQVTPRTQAGISRITVVTPRTTVGQSRITLSVPRTQTGVANLFYQQIRDQPGIANIESSTKNRLQLGRASIANIVGWNQLGTSRILQSVNRDIAGTARILQIVARTQVGRAAIARDTVRDQYGIAAIKQIRTGQITGRSSVAIASNNVISGVAFIRRQADYQTTPHFDIPQQPPHMDIDAVLAFATAQIIRPYGRTNRTAAPRLVIPTRRPHVG